MAISILAPAPAVLDEHELPSEQKSYADDDVDMNGQERPSKRVKTLGADMVTPGEIVTDDPQWMK